MIPNTNILGLDIADALALTLDQQRMEDTYRTVFRTVEGRAVLLDLMQRSHMLERRPANMNLAERATLDGMASFMIELLDLSGVQKGEQAAAMMLATSDIPETSQLPPMERAHDRTDARDTTDPYGPDPLGDDTPQF